MTSDQDQRPDHESPEPREEGAGSESHLGIAGRTARQFINSPITPLLILAFLAIGVLGLLFTPRQEDPTISVPMVDIFVQYEGASAEQVNNLVTDPLERIMSELPGVKHVYSRTQQGQAVVTVRFFVGEQMDQSVVRVHDKIQSNMDKIPPGVQRPLVKPVSVDDVPIVNVTLWSHEEDDVTLRKLGLEVLQGLEEVPDTGDGFVKGGRPERIRVDLKPSLLSGYGISPAQVARTIKAANLKQPAGNVEQGGQTKTVYTGSFLHGARDVASLIVGSKGGQPIHLREIAEVSRAPAETQRMVQFYTGAAWDQKPAEADGASAVTVAVAKKPGTNGVTVANNILDKLELLKGRLIPNNVQATITRNYGETANQKVNDLLGALMEAAIAVSILCLIGLGLRAASVVIVVIPLVVLVTIWSAWALGYTIDRVSLFALVFAIGILVDDATVVVENIFRRWLGAGRTDTPTAIDAVREVGNPTILATLTIIAALLPMGFVRGLMGPYMEPIPVLGSSAMLFSLFAAFIFVPWMAMRLRPQLKSLERGEKKERRMRERIGRIYKPIMRPLLERSGVRWVFLGSLVVLTVLSCALFAVKWVPVKVLPFANKPTYNVVINMPEGTALPRTANVTRRLAEKIRAEVPEVRALQSYVGTSTPFDFNGMVRHYYLRQKPWQADINVTLLDKDERERGSHAIALETREMLTPIAEEMGARIQVVEMPPGPPVRQTVVAEVYGQNAGVRRAFARDLTGMFEEVTNIVDEDNYLAEPYKQWRFEINTEKAERNGLSVKTINRNIQMLMGGAKVGDVKRGVTLEPTHILVQVPLATRSQLNRLANVPIVNKQGKSVPLGELGTFREEWVDPVIYHKDLRPVEYVTGEMEGRLGAPIYGMFSVEDKLADYTAPDGVQVSGMPMGLIGPPETDTQSGIKWAGAWTVTYETFRDMGIAFAAALVLIYGLIVWEFRDFHIALLIMAPIPLTLLGVVPGHWLLGAKFTATSMIGFIALAGIIVRNSILLVEFVKNEVEQGQPIYDAVVSAGQIRLRPILITALTLMAGSAAILTDPIFKGMATSLLFGAAVATILTLVVIPLGCITSRRRFSLLCGTECDVPSQEMHVGPATVGATSEARTTESGRPLHLRIGDGLVVLGRWAGLLLHAILRLVEYLLAALRRMLGGGSNHGGPSGGGPSGGSTPSPGGGSSGGDGAGAEGPSPESREDASSESTAEADGDSEGQSSGQSTGGKGRSGSQKRRGIRLNPDLNQSGQEGED